MLYVRHTPDGRTDMKPSTKLRGYINRLLREMPMKPGSIYVPTKDLRPGKRIRPLTSPGEHVNYWEVIVEASDIVEIA